MRQARAGMSLIELMIVIVIVAIIAAIAIPSLLASQRNAAELSTVASLRTLTTASTDFRVNDREQNGVNDFWTKDVAGLYTLYPAATPNSPIRLIDVFIAAADATPGGGDALTAPRYGSRAITDHVNRAPKSGHWFFALD
jgi:prepilin-type N-terminal cleavage/methylation domain-containing protein